jgi:dienelactone hydrolase
VTDQLDRVRSALAERYVIEREIGAGGMATVYLAKDLKHSRPVAVKVLKPELAQGLGTDRFLREIEMAAALTHAHILPLYDSGQAGGEADPFLYYVMPYLEGESLRERLEREPRLTTEDAIRVITEVTSALDYSHRHGVIHRDIKPENILLHDNQALVADFGIALELSAGEVTRLTGTGISVGTPHYMSPEQATGEREIDARSDVYSLGCVLYEMLAGRPPVDSNTLGQVLAAKVSGDTTPLNQLRPDLPSQITRAVERALATTPAKRFPTAAEFGSALALAAESAKDVARKRTRRRVAGAAAVLALVAALVAGLVYADRERARWARTDGLAELDRLARADQWDSVFGLGLEIAAIIPDDSAFLKMWSGLTGETTIRTEPAGAKVFRRPYDDSDTTSTFLGTTPLVGVRLPIWGSRLRVELAGYRTRELVAINFLGVLIGQTVLAEHLITLDAADAIPDGMVRVGGQTGPERDLVLGDFWMDRYEVTNRQFREFADAGGYEKPEYWSEPFVRDGREISWQEAMSLFVDRTGRPGPSTWYAGSYPDGQGDYPVGGVSWYEAVAYAQFTGKRLPTVHHWEQGLAHLLHPLMVPRSNIANATAGPAPAGSFKGLGSFGTYDQMGNVREWTYNEAEGGRFIVGGGWSDAEWRSRDVAPAWDRSSSNGFRLAQYLEDTDDLTQAHAPVTRTSRRRDYTSERPVGEGEFDIYKRMYDYDAIPLEPRVEQVDTAQHWIREHVSFTAAYGSERMAAYLYLPKRARPPYQAVVFWPGGNVFWLRRIDEMPEAHHDFFVTAGRAVVLPVFDGSFGRGPKLGPRTTLSRTEAAIEWVQDVRRTIDYLATRPDVDSSRIALAGHSWGGIFWPIPLAVEPRIKVGISFVGGLPVGGFTSLPEADPFNFLPRVRVPILMLGGRYDHSFPYEMSQKPMFELLGTDPAHKSFYVHEGSATVQAGHNVPLEIVARESLVWLDRYLGPVTVERE